MIAVDSNKPYPTSGSVCLMVVKLWPFLTLLELLLQSTALIHLSNNAQFDIYFTHFQIEDYFGQSINFEVFDHDKTNEDDYLGKTSISLVNNLV